MSAPIQYPVSDLSLVTRACKADEPLEPGDKRWFDFSGLRHDAVQQRLRAVFSDPPSENGYRHQLLCGHRGSGKSTELLQFQKWLEERAFQCVHIEVDVEYGLAELDFSDFFLMAAGAGEKSLGADGPQLLRKEIEPIIKWFAEVTVEDNETRKSDLSMEAEAQLGGKLPFGLGKLAAKFAAAMKLGTEHARRIRQSIKNHPSQLIASTRVLLEKAASLLAERGKSAGLVLLFDNVDRYTPEQIDQALLVGDYIPQLAVNAVFTIPVALEYSPRQGLARDRFGPPVILPMIAMRRRSDGWGATVDDSSYLEDAVSQTVAALGQRISVENLFMNPADARLLVKTSGGCIRDLMHLVTVSRQFTTGAQMSTQAVRRAIAEIRNTYVRQLTYNHYYRLAQIARRMPVERDELTLNLLYYRYALEYDDPDGQTWLDVHPLVLEIPAFQDAMKRVDPLARS